MSGVVKLSDKSTLKKELNLDYNIDNSLSKVSINKLLEYSYLNLQPRDFLEINNELLIKDPTKIYENPLFELMDFMRQPENFAFTCKWLFEIDLLPIQVLILQELWRRKYPMFIATRGGSKSFLLALYSVLRILFCPGSKIIFVGAGFRQSKILFEYVESFFRASQIFRNIIGNSRTQGPKHDTDRHSFYAGDSVIHALPIGDGQKIRGMRATNIISDEFHSMILEIFEVVIEGFASVNINPIEKIKKISNKKLLLNLGMDLDGIEDEKYGNQTIISGTAYYAFNHFYRYWQRYKAIVQSRGDIRKLEEIFLGEVPPQFDWRDYSVIRIPYDVLPEGMMDETHIAKARALMHSSKYQLEYTAVFVSDSNGFFKRSIIENCVTPVETIEGNIQFKASITGKQSCKYVYGVDPASEDDNFTIVILELHENHRRIVYGWSATKQKLRERLKKVGQDTSSTSYYSYCARKIRELMKIFPTDHIAIDKQGGGIPLIEAFHHKPDIQPGEYPLWPYLVRGKDDPFTWEKEEKPTDNESGLHIVHEFQFSDAKLTEESNHNLRKDLETKTLLFPMFDSAEIGLATENDIAEGREYDTLEDCVLEIEELKNELSTITHSRTPSGRDKWSTPEVKEVGGRIGRLRKDRYSALLMANQIARTINNTIGKIQHTSVGGYVGKHPKDNVDGPLYYGSYKAERLNYQGCAVIKER